jgi:hypothetical protein
VLVCPITRKVVKLSAASVTFTTSEVPAVTATLPSRAVSKPPRIAASPYMPGGTFVSVYAPLASVAVESVAGPVSVTVTPTSAAPPASVAIPLTLASCEVVAGAAVVCACPHAALATTIASTNRLASTDDTWRGPEKIGTVKPAQ